MFMRIWLLQCCNIGSGSRVILILRFSTLTIYFFEKTGTKKIDSLPLAVHPRCTAACVCVCSWVLLPVILMFLDIGVFLTFHFHNDLHHRTDLRGIRVASVMSSSHITCSHDVLEYYYMWPWCSWVLLHVTMMFLNIGVFLPLHVHYDVHHYTDLRGIGHQLVL